MSFDHYVYPGTNVLKNKLGIEDARNFDSVERGLTMHAAAYLRAEGITGKFDVEHLKSIHARIFGDVYDWAGEFRDIQIYKGGTEFAAPEDIRNKLDELFESVKDANYFKGLSKDETADGLADLMGKLNLIHPFREGNGRTQRVFLEQLARNAGYDLDFSKISENDMRNASMSSSRGNNRLMRYLFASNMTSIDGVSNERVVDNASDKNVDNKESVHDKPVKKGFFAKLKSLFQGLSSDDDDHGHDGDGYDV